MFVITEDGKLVEGISISNEEAEIINFVGTDNPFNIKCRGYICDADAKIIIATIAENYKLSYRKPRPAPSEQPVQIADAEFEDAMTEAQDALDTSEINLNA